MWLVWSVRVWLVVANAAALSFTVGIALLYQFSLTDPLIQIGLNQLGANTLLFLRPVILATIATVGTHALVVLYSLSPTRRLIVRVLALLTWSRSKQPAGVAGGQVFPEPLPASVALTTNSADTASVWSRYDEEITRMFVLWEVAFQTFQVYKISYLVASVSINRLSALVIVTNCWFSLILHCIMGNRPTAHIRLGRLLVDSSLDLVYNVVIPLAIFSPYYRDYDGSVSLYPVVFYYDDIWYVNAVSELRQIFVTSWLDLISKTSGLLSLQYQLWKAKVAIDGLRAYDEKRTVTVNTRPPEVLRARSPRSRLSRFLDLVLLLWGATIVSFHLTTTITSFRYHDPDCLLEMRPWGSLSYSCASLEISCSKRHTTGDQETMETILNTVDPLSIQNLILSNCAQLHVPAAIQKLKSLTMIKIYDSTLASWGVDAALRQAYHPQLQVIYLARVNASGFPEGLIAVDFPSTVWAIQFCETNISTLPPAIETAWAHVGIVGFEGNPELTEYPKVLTLARSVFVLSLGKNNLTTVPDGLLESNHFVGISMNGNPIDHLPDAIGNLDQLAFLNFVDTTIAAIPSSWMDSTLAAANPSKVVVLSARGSPLCELNEVQPVTKPEWLRIHCGKLLGGVYSYPIQEEDAWRRVNQ